MRAKAVPQCSAIAERSWWPWRRHESIAIERELSLRAKLRYTKRIPLPRPGAPFESWPEHVYDARYGFTWFVAPNTMVDHITVSVGSEEAVAAMHDTLDRLLSKHGAAIRARGGLRIIGDWRAVKSYTPEARRRFSKELSAGRPIASASVVVAPTNAFLRMAIKGADMALALTMGAKIELSSDIDAVLRRDGLHAIRVAPLDW